MAVVLVGHGSKSPDFDRALRCVASTLKKEKTFSQVVCAYLTVTSPSIEEAVTRCVQDGALEVRVLPYFVLSGKHVVRDIPEIVKGESIKHKGRAKVRLCPYLGFHEKIVDVVRERILYDR